MYGQMNRYYERSLFFRMAPWQKNDTKRPNQLKKNGKKHSCLKRFMFKRHHVSYIFCYVPTGTNDIQEGVIVAFYVYFKNWYFYFYPFFSIFQNLTFARWCSYEGLTGNFLMWAFCCSFQVDHALFLSFEFMFLYVFPSNF